VLDRNSPLLKTADRPQSKLAYRLNEDRTAVRQAIVTSRRVTPRKQFFEDLIHPAGLL
jgi:hypothetical protein